jgi:hypothetical protein
MTQYIVKPLSFNALRPELEKQLKRWNEMYYLDDDVMLIVARYYKWNNSKMEGENGWFNMTELGK